MRYGVIAFLVVTVVGLLTSSFTQVSQSQIGVVTTFGHVESDTLPEGPHFIAPVSRIHEVFTGSMPPKWKALRRPRETCSRSIPI